MWRECLSRWPASLSIRCQLQVTSLEGSSQGFGLFLQRVYITALVTPNIYKCTSVHLPLSVCLCQIFRPSQNPKGAQGNVLPHHGAKGRKGVGRRSPSELTPPDPPSSPTSPAVLSDTAAPPAASERLVQVLLMSLKTSSSQFIT